MPDFAAVHPDFKHFFISTSQTHLDIPAIYASISQTYWAKDIPYLMFLTSLENSLCIGLYDTSVHNDLGKPGRQIGFARWVTDCATFGWLSDVYVLGEYQGQGLGKWLVQVAVSLEEVKSCRNLLLCTTGAENLYQKYGGFSPLINENGRNFLGIRRQRMHGDVSQENTASGC